MRHAVILSWHAAPEPIGMPHQDRMLAFWAETLAETLLAEGWRVTLLVPLAAAPPMPEATSLGRALARQGIGLEFAAGADRLAQACAVDVALAALRPDAVHAPERLGLLGVALSRRAAGIAHRGVAMTLHARGPLLFRMEEEGRFLGDAEALVVDACERQAMRLADAVLTANADIAAWIRARGQGVTLTEALLPTVTPVAEAPIGELVLPLPLCSEAGLEFAIAALVRAAAHQPLALPVTFLGEPGPMTLGDAAQALLPLSARPGHINWRIAPADSWTGMRAALARPGVAVFCPTRRAAPPELLAFCAAAGLPVLAAQSLTTEAAARRFAQTYLLPRAERPAGSILARLPLMPPRTAAAPPPAPADEPPAPRPLPPQDGPGHDLTVYAPDTPAMRASLDAQSLQGFAWRPPGEDPAECGTRFAVLTGGATALMPEALAALRRIALATGAPAITAWDTSCRPLGGELDIALLRPRSLLGHLLLLDLHALRGVVTCSPAEMVEQLAGYPGGVLALHATLASAQQAPEQPRLPQLPLPPALARARRMALHAAAQLKLDELDTANRGTSHYFKLLARRLGALGAASAARDAWALYLAQEPDDPEGQDRHAALCLRLEDRVPDSPALIAFAERHGVEALPETTEEVLAAAHRRGAHGWALLVAMAPLLIEDVRFPQALARARLRLPYGSTPREPAMPEAVRAAYQRALAGGFAP